MFRLRGTPILLHLAGLSLLLTGCNHDVYRSVYSTRRNYYVPPKEKPAASVLPVDKPAAATVIPPAPAPALPDLNALPPAAPGGAPAIPGLDAAPPMTPPAN